MGRSYVKLGFFGDDMRFFYISHRIHVWNIYLHLDDFWGKCWYIFHTWILWVCLYSLFWGVSHDFIKIHQAGFINPVGLPTCNSPHVRISSLKASHHKEKVTTRSVQISLQLEKLQSWDGDVTAIRLWVSRLQAASCILQIMGTAESRGNYAFAI